MSLRGINNSKQNIFLFIIIFILFIVVVGLFFIQYKRSENLKNTNNSVAKETQTDLQKKQGSENLEDTNNSATGESQVDSQKQQQIDKYSLLVSFNNLCDSVGRQHGEVYKPCKAPLYFNFGKEVGATALCCQQTEEDSGTDYYLFFGMVPSGNNWQAKGAETFLKCLQRHYNFEDLRVADVDGDGFDEIMWNEMGWTTSWRGATFWVFSPKTEEYFYRKDDYNYNDEKNDWEVSTSYSNNMTEQIKKAFQDIKYETMY